MVGIHETTSAAESLADLRDQVTTLSQQVVALTGQLAALAEENARLGGKDVGRESVEGVESKPVSRRGLIAAAGGTAAALLIGAQATPAAADDGDSLVLGVDTNTA